MVSDDQKGDKPAIDPQKALYEEHDIKYALNPGQKDAKFIANYYKRRSRQNYLAYNDPFDLNILLDDIYWSHKESKLVHAHSEIVRLSMLNKLEINHFFEGKAIHEFIDFKEPIDSEHFKIKHVYWQNTIDDSVPYQSGFKEFFWNYI